jgi:hypothetical protein
MDVEAQDEGVLAKILVGHIQSLVLFCFMA